MKPATATRMAVQVGVATTLIGGALAAAPGPVGDAVGLDPLGARVIGVADLVLVPGLLRGRPRWPWMAARAGLNLAIAGYGRKRSQAGAPRVGALAAGLVAITAADSAVAVTLWRDERR